MSHRVIERVALVGARAVGKSTLGAALAARLGWTFVDTDELLAARVGVSAGDYLARAGEAAFRAVEAEVCAIALRGGASRVVALGGGAVTQASVRELLAHSDVLVVWLEASVPCLVARQRAAPRPPLTDLPLESEVNALLTARRAHHEQVAVLRVNTESSNVDACVEAILDTMPAPP